MDSGASVAKKLCSGQCCVHVSFLLSLQRCFIQRYKVVPPIYRLKVSGKDLKRTSVININFLQIKKGNTSFGISHKYLVFPTLALSKSGSRVEGNTFLSACFQAPLYTYSVVIKVQDDLFFLSMSLFSKCFSQKMYILLEEFLLPQKSQRFFHVVSGEKIPIFEKVMV